MNNEEKEIFFSAIVTAYNCEKYIIEALESIEWQTFKDYEVIVIDDKSNDTTYNLISEFIHEKINWALYSNDVNKGVVYSRNKAIMLSKGRYIAILDGDDVWEKEKLEKQYQRLKDDEIGLCYTSYSFIDEQSKSIKYVYRTKETASYNSLLMENYIGCSTVVLKSEIAKEYKMNHKVAHEDYYYWLTILKDGIKAKGILEPLVRYRIHDTSRSYNKFKAAMARFNIYYNFEELGLFRSLLFFIIYGINATKKYIKLCIKKRA